MLQQIWLFNYCLSDRSHMPLDKYFSSCTTQLFGTTCYGNFHMESNSRPASYDHLPTFRIVLQRLQYFHNHGKIILHLTPSIESFQQTHFLAMYYSRVFKPHSGPERKCSLPVSVTGYQPLIHYSTCWSRATQSNSLRCCLDRRG